MTQPESPKPSSRFDKQRLIAVSEVFAVPASVRERALQRLAPDDRPIDLRGYGAARAALSAAIDFNAAARLPLKDMRRMLPSFDSARRDFFQPAQLDEHASTEAIDAVSHHVRATPVPPALVLWHKERFDRLFHEVIADKKFYDTVARILGDELPEGAQQPDTRRRDLAYVNYRVAQVWGLPAPKLMFKTLAESEKYFGQARMETGPSRHAGRWEYRFYSDLRECDDEGRARKGTHILETSMHEFAHAIERWLIEQLRGVPARETLVDDQQPRFPAVGEDWPLKGAAVHFAINDSVLGRYFHPEHPDVAYGDYFAQLRERHARWFGHQCVQLFKDCLHEYWLAHQGVAGRRGLLMEKTAGFLDDPETTVRDYDPTLYIPPEVTNNVDFKGCAARLRGAVTNAAGLKTLLDVMAGLERDLRRVGMQAYGNGPAQPIDPDAKRIYRVCDILTDSIEHVRNNVMLIKSCHKGTVAWWGFREPQVPRMAYETPARTISVKAALVA